MVRQPAEGGGRVEALIPYLILFIVPVLLYARTAWFEFIPSWDDAEYVIENRYIMGVTLENIEGAFTGVFVGNYSPVHIISYMLDYAVWGLNPAGYHASNVLLHGVNALLLFAFMKRITGRGRASFAAALLFAVHPLNVENVAWVAERKTLLTTLFSLLSLLAYVDFREKGGAARLILSLTLFVLAVLSKPLAVVLPLIITAQEFFIARDGGLKRWLALTPFYGLALLTALVSVWAHASTKSMGAEALSAGLLFGTVYPTMLPVFWKYIKLIVLPFGLSGYYDTELYSSWLAPEVALSLMAWVAVFVAALWKCGGQVRFWFLWYWLWLLPVSNVIPLQVYYADRYMYMPAAGLFLIFALALDRLAGKAVRLDGASDAPKGAGMAAWAAVIVIAAYFGAVAYARTAVWHDEVSFWEDAVEKSPGQAKVRMNLGYAYEMRDRLDEAEREYAAAVSIYPAPEAVSNLEMVRQKAAYLRSRSSAPEPARSDRP